MSEQEFDPRDLKKYKPKTNKEKAIDFIKSLLIYGGAFIILRVFVVESNVIPSGSMKDTLLIGDYLLVEKVSFLFDGPSRGDIVTFDYPYEEMNIFSRTWRFVSKLWGGGNYGPRLLIKRCVGEPGDVMELKDKTLYVNDKPQEEPYLRLPGDAGEDWGPYTVPEGHYFMMGDNRYDSYDCRFIGPVPEEFLRGRAMLMYFSLAPTKCPRHNAPVEKRGDEFFCTFGNEKMRPGWDIAPSGALRFDDRIRWFRIGTPVLRGQPIEPTY